MGYYEYLCALLAPMGVYRLDDGVGASELMASAAALDAAADALGEAERECCLLTAAGEGLTRMEALFSHVGARASEAERRAAIASLCAIGEDGFTVPKMNAALLGCGVRATVEERADGVLRVRFPDVVGQPQDFAKIERIVLDILPCHLAVEFYLAYLTWRQCAERAYSWGGIEEAEHTWKSFEESFAATVSE